MLERGKRNPSLNVIAALAEGLGLPTTALIPPPKGRAGGDGR
ncbi:MAG: hypothetical protein AVDCRST_MAG93-4991 [uncultured Chloroflexia bacterium]|uniref:HTH cro/C1-type domain-containing protein n=1 Tax=uncultured Chloroflexia bacterium TaxID=1672391 RepID=A0A6J4KIS0_9CHLR|nr:MAG: hypothetical protein AVDCRST_MAG93-4991 [uncultured Chloroflexia bacterium]